MFTPHRVAGGLGQDVKLEKARITIGTFVASGEQFRIEDGNTEPRAAHLMIEHAWIGTSEFREINHEGSNKVSSLWADWGSEEEFRRSRLGEESCLGERERTIRYQSLHVPTFLVAVRAGSSSTSCSLKPLGRSVDQAEMQSAVYRVGPLPTSAVGRGGVANSSRVILEAGCVHRYPISLFSSV